MQTVCYCLIILFLSVSAMCGFPRTGTAADESTLFSSNVQPDALIVLDLSGSMDWNPAGGTNIWGDASCNGPFYSASGAGHTTDCSRISIAKRAIFSLLDDNNSGSITSTGSSDDLSLNVRVGYMRFYNCSSYTSDSGSDYGAGCNRLIHPLGTKYSTLYCGSSTSCSSMTGSCSSGTCIRGEDATGGTPVSGALSEAKLYLDWHKGQDSAAADCRKKFVVLITDGADTFACSGSGQETQSDMYKRRRELVARAKALGDAGYKVFVIGFGSAMPTYLKNTLNWAAYYGQTDNSLDANTGSTSAYSLGASLYPSGISSCQSSATSGTCDGSSTNCFATSNDPGNIALSGYAYIAANADDLATALKNAFSEIRSGNYTFSVASISSARIASENDLYEASFEPQEDDSFWVGHLRKFSLNTDGTVGSQVWDAGTQLQSAAYSSRNMVTCAGAGCSTFTAFSNALDPRYFGYLSNDAADQASRDRVVGFIQGNPGTIPSTTEQYNDDDWKLGDIWHSSPIVITTPSAGFRDIIDTGTPTAFESYRASHVRTSASGARTVMVGANDGQLHVFRSSDGQEVFSFLPPNLLPKLKLISHSVHPTSKTHQFFIDGAISAADVWLGSGSGATKSSSDWHSLAVVGLGRGVGPNSAYLWSSSSACANFDGTSVTTFGATYSTGTPYYCGYYAFDVTSPPTPVFKWRITPSPSEAPYLGDPWSKMSFGRVSIGGNEKWVGFIGGGGYEYTCETSPTEPALRGKGFYVIDLLNGNVLWSYTQSSNSAMAYSIPAAPKLVDSDNDGFVDTAYVGDLGGNMWRFRFCSNAAGASCGTSSWSASRAFQASSSERRPIYDTAAVSRDSSGALWVYWGTGDKQCPTVTTTVDRFFAIRDPALSCTSSAECAGGGVCQSKMCSYSYGMANLQNISSAGQTYAGALSGYFMTMPGTGEKILSDPLVFSGTVYFLSYIPASGAIVCATTGGTSMLYGLKYSTGAGGLAGGTRSMSLGAGLATGLIVSTSPDGQTTRLYLTNSGGPGSAGAGYKSNTQTPTSVTGGNPSRTIYWRDRRTQ